MVSARAFLLLDDDLAWQLLFAGPAAEVFADAAFALTALPEQFLLDTLPARFADATLPARFSLEVI